MDRLIQEIIDSTIEQIKREQKLYNIFRRFLKRNDKKYKSRKKMVHGKRIIISLNYGDK